MTSGHHTREGPASAWATPGRSAALGVLGSVACAASMILTAVGVAAATAATSMAGMTGTGPATPAGHPAALVRVGPWLMVASALRVAAAFAFTRLPVTAPSALLAGAVLYVGMYAQRSLPVMCAGYFTGQP
jgi:hypothetical protein